MENKIVKVVFSIAAIKRNVAGFMTRAFVKAGKNGQIIELGKNGRISTPDGYCLALSAVETAKKKFSVEAVLLREGEFFAVVEVRDHHGQTAQLVVGTDSIIQ